MSKFKTGDRVLFGMEGDDLEPLKAVVIGETPLGRYQYVIKCDDESSSDLLDHAYESELTLDDA